VEDGGAFLEKQCLALFQRPGSICGTPGFSAAQHVNKIIHWRPHAGGFLLDRALVLDEKQLSHDEFIEMQIRANLVVHIHHGVHKAVAFAGKFSHLLQNSHGAILL
jgi:hypothetical protein